MKTTGLRLDARGLDQQSIRMGMYSIFSCSLDTTVYLLTQFLFL